MARPKRSLSDLLKVDGEEAEAPTPPLTLAVGPALSADQPVGQSVGQPAPVVEDDAKSDLAPETASLVVTERSTPDVAASSAPAQFDAPVARPAERSARPQTPSPVRSIKAAPEPAPLPLYLELTRKEARFRQDQLNDLTTLTRQLNRRRASTVERITDNTLIRVAVDMMLKVADSLDGATEAELLQAVSAKLKR